MPRDTRFSRRQFAMGALAIASTSAIVLPPARAAALEQDSMNEPDGTYLFGDGRDLMPTVPVRWRVITQTAKPRDEAEAFARTLGFVMPISSLPFSVENLTTGETELVVAHVAHSSFNAEGDRTIRYVEEDEAAPYAAFELIVADADTPETIGSGTWIGSTDPFTAPAGEQDMEMAALVVNVDQPTIAVPDPGDYPLLGYVYQNAVNIIHADNHVTEVEDGETIVLEAGDVIEYAGNRDDVNASVCFARFVGQRTW